MDHGPVAETKGDDMKTVLKTMQERLISIDSKMDTLKFSMDSIKSKLDKNEDRISATEDVLGQRTKHYRTEKSPPSDRLQEQRSGGQIVLDTGQMEDYMDRPLAGPFGAEGFSWLLAMEIQHIDPWQHPRRETWQLSFEGNKICIYLDFTSVVQKAQRKLLDVKQQHTVCNALHHPPVGKARKQTANLPNTLTGSRLHKNPT
ncbi:hypothetical protein NDU88_003516 [Pleurodeles waltl]|uniref:t-SNARE coiled-coil homology domain-containing protein n=1 Tax=Pleurodeles waltl TaxID=8319 RepID=A0AAV7ME13_PLEWA|nr:hypothetical protein NDU88_003516 [Pleurodeles waltl]